VTIPLIEPLNGLHTDNRRPRFSWLGLQGSYEFVLDDNPDFTSPFIRNVLGNSYSLTKDLDFGTYYWKVRHNEIESPVWKFRVESSVVLSREKERVKNVGNVDVFLRRITGLLILGVNESLKVRKDENVTAEQV
jgi:hypothetical protein